VSPEPTASAPTASVEPEVAGATWPTCEELVPEVVRISEENASLPVKVLQVYNATVVNDQTAEYDAGSLAITPGETRVTVLQCRGDAAADDGSQVPISFELQVDLNEEFYVFFEPQE